MTRVAWTRASNTKLHLKLNTGLLSLGNFLFMIVCLASLVSLSSLKEPRSATKPTVPIVICAVSKTYLKKGSETLNEAVPKPSDIARHSKVVTVLVPATTR